MKIVFFIAEDFSPGAGYLISFLKSQGHEVKLVFDPRQFNRGYSRNKLFADIFSVENYNLRKIKMFQPDMVCFSVVTAHYQWALRMAKRVKKEIGCKIIFGGVHPTLVPEEVRKHNFIDEVVVGCGIEYFGGKFEPDNLWPEREMFLKELPAEHRKAQLFMTSFGCPYSCHFCGNEQLRKVNKHRMIHRTIEGCIKELKYLKEGGMKYVLFVDDIFTCDRIWLTDFLFQYKLHIDLPFCCFIHPKFIDAVIAAALSTAGCHTAWMGIQTGHEQLRRDILGRNETNKEIIDAAQAIKKAGIKLMVDHIFGIPFESELTQDISYALYKEIKPDIVNCYQLLYFPKAKIIEHAIKFGYLLPGEETKINRGEGVVYQTNNKGQFYYDMYAKGMVAIPLNSILWELLPMIIIKLVAHIRAGRMFMVKAIIENELYFTGKAILKKL
ncbi:MAG: B12-binding domain-containing radical SAM protein [Candidatus Omnitrophota bacterium]